MSNSDIIPPRDTLFHWLSSDSKEKVKLAENIEKFIFIWTGYLTKNSKFNIQPGHLAGLFRTVFSRYLQVVYSLKNRSPDKIKIRKQEYATLSKTLKYLVDRSIDVYMNDLIVNREELVADPEFQKTLQLTYGEQVKTRIHIIC